MCNIYPNLRKEFWSFSTHAKIYVARKIAKEHGLEYVTPLPSSNLPEDVLRNMLASILAWISSPQNPKRFDILQCGWPRVKDYPILANNNPVQ